jgi:ubiquinone biosynthesis protein
MLSPTSLREAATDEALGLLPVLRTLPRRLDRITTSLERGTLTARMRVLADEADRYVGLFLSIVLILRVVIAISRDGI